jgi:multiple RNA-binding domain-containing protein 1
MASSRIFIKGLPPSISEEDFKKHFSANSEITDAKLIPQRRIGYVGYKTPEDAAKAVKYFNRSFIRMSKIGVELARPVGSFESISTLGTNFEQISDATLPKSRKVQREEERENTKARLKERAEAGSKSSLSAGTKRKRSDVDESDPKLKEFLEVMQPAFKLKTLAKSMEDESTMEPPTKVQALEIPEGESDGEYETVPKKSRKKSPPKVAPAPIVVEEPVVTREAVVDPAALDATDDDWLRSRTNRLLGLMDPEDIVGGSIGNSTSQNIEPVAETNVSVAEPANSDDMLTEETLEEEEEEKPDPTIEAIKTSGRLFVRNLPYSASEDDLRKHFETFGSLEEVRSSPISQSISLPFHDEYPDRDSLCFKHVM